MDIRFYRIRLYGTAILAVKTLSTLESERRRFAILYRLGVDTRMQKSAVRKQIGAFFLMPFAFPLLMTIPVGVFLERSMRFGICPA